MNQAADRGKSEKSVQAAKREKREQMHNQAAKRENKIRTRQLREEGAKSEPGTVNPLLCGTRGDYEVPDKGNFWLQ